MTKALPSVEMKHRFAGRKRQSTRDGEGDGKGQASTGELVLTWISVCLDPSSPGVRSRKSTTSPKISRLGIYMQGNTHLHETLTPLQSRAHSRDWLAESGQRRKLPNRV